LGKFLKQADVFSGPVIRDEDIPPTTHGIDLTMLPRPEHFYFSFGKPIDTTPYRGKHEDKEVLF